MVRNSLKKLDGKDGLLLVDYLLRQKDNANYMI